VGSGVAADPVIAPTLVRDMAAQSASAGVRCYAVVVVAGEGFLGGLKRIFGGG